MAIDVQPGTGRLNCAPRWRPIGIPLIALLIGANAAPAARFAHEHRLGRIRIFYDTTGTNAVDVADGNNDGVPDQVEDIVKQTWAAHALFVEALGFPDPFKSERFLGAKFLDIHLLHKRVLRSNGIAYDEPQRFRRPADPTNSLSLCFNVATSVKAPHNLTPAHEYFHLIQYGVTFFKNAWYSEGMARWSEKALGEGSIGNVAPESDWPPSDNARAELFKMAYGAADRLWNPLAKLDDGGEIMPESSMSPELTQLTYSTGEKVLRDLRLGGWRLMRDVLLALGRVDDAACRELGYDTWSEENQNSKKNNPYILGAVSDVLDARRKRPKPPGSD